MSEHQVFDRIRDEIGKNDVAAVHEGHAGVPAVRLLRRRRPGADRSSA